MLGEKRRRGRSLDQEFKMSVGRTEVEIIKPRTDKREYRRIVLPNSLEALLISDPETDKVIVIHSFFVLFSTATVEFFL